MEHHPKQQAAVQYSLEQISNMHYPSRTHQSPSKSKSIEWGSPRMYFIFPIFIFFLSFITYYNTLCPTISPRDGAELTTAAATLGIPHPPSYPLYVLLGKLFTFLPLGTIAWRVNLMSAFFGSLCIMLVYMIIARITKNKIAGMTGSLLLAFGPMFWNMAVYAEVFQLNNFFIALCIYTLLLWQDTKRFKTLLWFVFLFGLSLTNHHTMILLVPGFFYFIWTSNKSIFFNIKNWLYMVLCFFSGLIIYIYLPLRAAQDPYLNWGNPDNLSRFLENISRAQYGTLGLNLSFSFLTAQVAAYLKWLLIQFTYFGTLLGIIGVWISFRKYNKFFWYLLLMFFLSGIFFTILSSDSGMNDPIRAAHNESILFRLVLPSFIAYSIWIGIGICSILNISSRKIYTNSLNIVFIIYIATSCAYQYPKADKSHYYYVEDLAKNILHSLKPESILLCSSDTALFSLWYMQSVEGIRKDVKIISTHQHKWRAAQSIQQWPELIGLDLKLCPDKETEINKIVDSYPSAYSFLNDIIIRNTEKFHIYSELAYPPEITPYANFLAPCGLVYEILQDSTNEAKLIYMISHEHLWNEYQYKSNLKNANLNDFVTRENLSFYANAHNFAGAVYANAQEYDKAMKEFEKALEILPSFPATLQNIDKIIQETALKID